MAIEERRTVKSKHVGPGTLSAGGRTTAYRAIVELMCGMCGQPIQPGALFSRHAPYKGAIHLAPTCIRCRPLRLEDTGETETAATDTREGQG